MAKNNRPKSKSESKRRKVMSQAVKKDEEDTNIERLKVMKTIKVKLSISEVADRAKSAAEYQRKVDELTEELDGHKKRLKPQIDESKGELHRLLEVCEDGREERTVEVEMVKDYFAGQVEYFYEGQSVEKHNMTVDDRQQDMFVPESAVGTQSKDEEIGDIIEEETNRKTKHDGLTV
jgi:hypothetical protein